MQEIAFLIQPAAFLVSTVMALSVVMSGSRQGNPIGGMIAGAFVMVVGLVSSSFLSSAVARMKDGADTKTESTPAPSSSSSSSSSSIPWAEIAQVGGAVVVLVIVGIALWMILPGLNAKRTAAIEQRRRSAEIAAQVAVDWKELRRRDEALVNKWSEPDHDLALLLSMPAIRDVNVPTTAAAIEALLALDTTRSERPPVDCENANASDYAKALRTAEVAADAAITYAKREAITAMPATERRALETAQRLLAVAMDSGASPAERRLAYERVRAIMDDLHIDAPAPAIEQIETTTRALLEAAS